MGVKWPSDVYLDGAKLGGVLVERAGEMEGQVQVVVSVGINVSMGDTQAASIDQDWIDLQHACAALPSRTARRGGAAPARGAGSASGAISGASGASSRSPATRDPQPISRTESAAKMTMLVPARILDSMGSSLVV